MSERAVAFRAWWARHRRPTLLAGSLITGAADGPPRLRAGLAWAALGAYAAFLLALVTG
jgi:hypothetical protein